MQYSINDIENITKRFGVPVYVFDEEAFIENYRHFENCFSTIYDKYKVSYSFKTNYAPYICQVVKKQGGFAEVVSDMELEIARGIGYDSEEIVYNGPVKGQLAYEHLKSGGFLNVDNFEELRGIIELAAGSKERIFQIGLRVNIDIGQSFISRFGIDEYDIAEAFAAAKRAGNVEIIGLHCHISRSRSLEAWQRRINKMLLLADTYFACPPKYISLGSGMYGVMAPSLAQQFDDDIPTYEQYAQCVAGIMAGHYKDPEKPILFTEPGTTLVNKYIDFIAQVVAIKHIKGKTFVVLNGSKHNIGEICELKRMPIQIVHSGAVQEHVSDADLVGYTCLEHDVLYHGFCGSIAAGDYVVFENVGGYSNVLKPPFISPNCAMVTAAGKTIKNPETTREIMCTYE